MVGVTWRCSSAPPSKERSAMEDFLSKVLNDTKKDTVGSKLSIQHDDWDFTDWSKIIAEMQTLSLADDKLTAFTPTGHEAMADTFFSLYKAMPTMEDKKNMRPSYLVNHRVAQEVSELKEYTDLRTYSALDIVAAGMACVTMEPELEVLFDKLKDEQDLAQKLDQMQQQLQGAQGESDSVEEMLQKALEDGDAEGAQNYQDQLGKLGELMDKLREDIENGKSELDKKLDGKMPEISQGLGDALNKAKEQADNVDSLSNSWGLDPGSIKKMSAEKRIELAKRINTEKFRKIAQIIGPMRRLAMSEQSKKLEFAKDEIYDLELGSDIEHVLPEELLFLTDEEIDMLFFEKFYNDNLMQFKLRGTEKVAKGNILFVEDHSSSMAGDRTIWAKAVGLALLQIAKSQNREFTSIAFGGPGVWKEFDFNYKTRTVSTVDYANHRAEFNELDGTLDFAETFMNSGTDFMTPLSRAMNRTIAQFENEGKIKADIVFCTDGQAGVPDEFLKKLAEEKERTGVRIFGVLIGNEVSSEPINTICDGRIFTIKDLISGKDISHIFRDV